MPALQQGVTSASLLCAVSQNPDKLCNLLGPARWPEYQKARVGSRSATTSCLARQSVVNHPVTIWMQDPGKRTRHPCTSAVLFLTSRDGLLFHIYLIQLTPFSSCHTAGARRERSPDQSFAGGGWHLCTGAGPSLRNQWPHPTQGAAAATGAAGRPVPLCGCQCWGGPALPVSALRLPLKAGPADPQCRLPCGWAVSAAALTAVSPEVCHPGLLCCKIGKKGKTRDGKKRKKTKQKEKKRKDYIFRRQFNEKPSIIPGCPVVLQDRCCETVMLTTWWLACVASCNGWNGF